MQVKVSTGSGASMALFVNFVSVLQEFPPGFGGFCLQRLQELMSLKVNNPKNSGKDSISGQVKKWGECIELCIELVTGISEGDPTSGLCASGGQRFPEAGFEADWQGFTEKRNDQTGGMMRVFSCGQPFNA